MTSAYDRWLEPPDTSRADSLWEYWYEQGPAEERYEERKADSDLSDSTLSFEEWASTTQQADDDHEEWLEESQAP